MNFSVKEDHDVNGLPLLFLLICSLFYHPNTCILTSFLSSCNICIWHMNQGGGRGTRPMSLNYNIRLSLCK